MKKTKYLFKDNQELHGLVSVSQIQTFLSCKKKWEYGYIDELKPRVDRSYLTIGKLCHVGMQSAMYAKWRYPHNDWGWWREIGLKSITDKWDNYMQETELLPEEIPDMKNVLYDAQSVFYQAFEEFQPWKYDVMEVSDGKTSIPALELHFMVPCYPSKGLHGFIDSILYDRETGFTWCVDYKFRKTLAPDEDETYNIQNAVYAYACQKMGINITGTMTWQHINTPASDPQILKDGKVSKAKIKTTWDHYRQFCENNGINPAIYEDEMREKLSDIEWYRSTLEYRNQETINRIWNECVIPAVKGIKSAYNKKANNYRSLYPWNCKMCQFQSLCQAELRDYDVGAVIAREYTKRATRNEAEATESALAPAT